MSGIDLPLDYAIRPAKQEAQRHYGSHPYFTKRAWNVVQEYIKHFSSPGDTVLDPFGGSGVTAVEALVLRRKAIYVDLNPWACFLARQTAFAPVRMSAIHTAFADVQDYCKEELEQLWKVSNHKLAERPPQEWYPKGVHLPDNADAEFVEELFTPRMLHGLAKLRAAIMKVKDQESRDLLLMAFSATLVRINKTFLSATNRAESRGGSAIFSIYRYKVAKKTVELPLWPQFEQRFRKLVEAKRETNELIGDFHKDGHNAVFRQGSATELRNWMKPESVDYIYTDPPYGAHIAYLDLSTMWTAWLKLPLKNEDRKKEVIEGGNQKKSRSDYQGLLSQSLVEMEHVLRSRGWLSMVFAHRDTAYWEALVSACEQAGFSYQNTVVQPVGVVWSMHKKKNPLKVLSGELVLNFQKTPKRRKARPMSSNTDPLMLVRNRCEREILEKTGASTEQLHHVVVPALLEAGLLEKFSREKSDLVPLLKDHFIFDGDAKLWQLPTVDRLSGRHEREALVRYFVLRYMAKMNGSEISPGAVCNFVSAAFGADGKPKLTEIKALLHGKTLSAAAQAPRQVEFAFHE